MLRGAGPAPLADLSIQACGRVSRRFRRPSATPTIRAIDNIGTSGDSSMSKFLPNDNHSAGNNIHPENRRYIWSQKVLTLLRNALIQRANGCWYGIQVWPEARCFPCVGGQ